MASPPAGRSNQGVATTPTHGHGQCSNRIIHKCVVTKLSPYWAGVCKHLEYSPDKFRRANDKKSVTAVLEYWISVGEKEGRPKTWSMFAAEVLSNNQHPTVSTEICESLRREGIMISPPTSRSHDPSPKQAGQYPRGPSTSRSHDPPLKTPPQLVQDNLSSITEVPDGGITKTGHPTNQSDTRKTALPIVKKCDMKTMYKCVVSKLAPYWTTVGDYLEYSVRERNAFKGADNKKSLAALLENWISTDNGRQPKTWPTFTRVLMELDQDLSISLGSEICAKLEIELSSSAAGSTTPPSKQPPARSVSTPSGHHPAHLPVKQSSSFPTADRPMNIPTYRQQSGDDDVRKRLEYEMSQMSIAEETHEQPLQRPQYGQSYAPPHQPPYDTRISDHLPPSATYTEYPSVTGYGPPASMMTGLYQPSHPSSTQPCHPSLIRHPCHYPPQYYPSMGRSPGLPSMGRSSGLPSMGRSSGLPSMGPSPSMGRSSGLPSMGCSSGLPSMGRSSGLPSMGRSSGLPSMGPSLRPFHPSFYRASSRPSGRVEQGQVPPDPPAQQIPQQNLQQQQTLDQRATNSKDEVDSLDQSNITERVTDTTVASDEDANLSAVKSTLVTAAPSVTSPSSSTSSHSCSNTTTNTTEANVGRQFNVWLISSTHTTAQSVVQTVAAPSLANTKAPIESTQSTAQSTEVQATSSTEQIITEDNNDEQITIQEQSTLHATTSVTTTDDSIPIVAAPFKWKKGKMLGRGGFGQVFLCMDEDNDRQLAVKEVEVDPNFSNDTRKAVESLEKEISVLQKITHNRIIQYYGTERTKNSVRIFMEYMPGGSLFQYIDQYGALKEQKASKYTGQLLEGVKFLHDRRIVHRDIKGANILMDLSGHVKIADFGASKLLCSIYLSSRTHEKKHATQKSVVGTAYWMAPEVIKGESVNHKADIWSIGCTVVEMLTCSPPYGELESVAAIFRIASGPMSVELPSECSDHVHDFLSHCFTSVVKDRPEAAVLLEHQFVKTGNRSVCLMAQSATTSQVNSHSECVTQTASAAVNTSQLSSHDHDTTNGGNVATVMANEAEKDSTGKSTPSTPQTRQTPGSSNANASNAAFPGSTPNIDNNSTLSKLLPDKETVPSNAALMEWQNCEQLQKDAMDAVAKNILGNHTQPMISNLVVHMYLMKGNQVCFAPPSSLPVNVDCGEISYNSLKPFVRDIHSSINVEVILPSLISNGIVTPSDHQFFTSQAYTDIQKQQKLACLVASLEESHVEMFLQCLADTSDYAPHDTLLKTIRKAKKTTSESNEQMDHS